MKSNHFTLGAFMFYPLFFKPVYKEIVWGGRKLEKKFNRTLPEGRIAESWEICCHRNGKSVVLNGGFKDNTLEELIIKYKVQILGQRGKKFNTFPLLIKLIDANAKLSVQVHPNDDYALAHEGEFGKTEMWYILYANEGAQIIYGIKEGTRRDAFKKSIKDGTLEEHLNFIDVKKDDVFFIPSGTVHAILDGILIAEIQQNSDTTYRVYDWNRVDKNGKTRPLHIKKALDVIRFGPDNTKNESYSVACADYEIYMISKCNYFTVEKLWVRNKYADKPEGDSFYAYTSIEGNGKLHYGNISYDLPPGTSFLIPASMGEYTIEGDITLLKSYI
jgi:mannose-6-phosphate isomerase